MQDSFTSTGLVVSSKLPRFSDLYTLEIASADPKSISANRPVQFTKSVTQWYLSLSLKHTMIFCSCTLVEHTRTWERKICTCMLKQFFCNISGSPRMEFWWRASSGKTLKHWSMNTRKNQRRASESKLLPTPFDGTLIGTGIALLILRTELNCLWQAWGRVTYEMLLKIYLLLSISSEVKFTFKWYIRSFELGQKATVFPFLSSETLFRLNAPEYSRLSPKSRGKKRGKLEGE